MAEKMDLGEALALLVKRANLQVLIQANMSNLRLIIPEIGDELKEARDREVQFVTVLGPDYVPEGKEILAALPGSIFVSQRKLFQRFVIADNRDCYYEASHDRPGKLLEDAPDSSLILRDIIEQKIADEEYAIRLR